MTSQIDQLRNTLLVYMSHEKKFTGEQLREQLHYFHIQHAKKHPPGLNDDELEKIAKEVEASQGIRADLGAAVIEEDENFIPWLDEATSSIDPFYWERYKMLLIEKVLSKDVVISTDKVTNKILGLLGNPKNRDKKWDRRGMVVGRVQSGKTANYVGLICRAADAGYKFIVVIAGISNNLRNQTQKRIDEGFVGYDTSKQNIGRNEIGVGRIRPEKRPVSLTNTIDDFNKQTATMNTSQISSYNVPLILVVKKNTNTLNNLIEWLRDNSTVADRDMIEQPMLLIDDEADNASINTKYQSQNVTKINGQIRDLLNMFRHSSYVGYTATPFANIFIDPEQEHEMYEQDLFPKDFIIGLGTPSNYFGATKVFDYGLRDRKNPIWLRYLDDNEDVLPISHKKEYEVVDLPTSLYDAVRTFLLAKTIRNVRGDSHRHCSMLVNSSRFIAVQHQLSNRLHEILENIINSARIYGNQGDAGLKDYEMNALYKNWKKEYGDLECDWTTIQKNLFRSISAAKVVEVNSESDGLNYESSGNVGQTVIAVGGFSLSRGLTLEGLVVTWFLRNTMMYDTLMQMGRWFGYRDGYEDLCRIWMPPSSIGWYSFIAAAAEELHGNLRKMDEANATPRDFGLAVRSHDAYLKVTARNKMGTGKKIITNINRGTGLFETTNASISHRDIKANIKNAKSFVSAIKEADEVNFREIPRGFHFSNVPTALIDQFLAKWKYPNREKVGNTRLLKEYIKNKCEDELRIWDVFIPSLQKGKADDTLGLLIVPQSRSVEISVTQDFMSFSGKNRRLTSRGDERVGVDQKDVDEAEFEYRMKEPNRDFPDWIYRNRRKRGLLVLHYLQVRLSAKEDRGMSDINSLLPDSPVVGWAVSLPESGRPVERVEYVINSVAQRQIFGEDEEDEEMGDLL